MVQFLTEDEPLREVAVEIVPGIRRMVANNPSKMTYLGTNTYLIDTADGTLIVDPGPDLPAHIAAIRAVAGRVAGILATHSHFDHVQSIPALQIGLDVPVYALGNRVAADIALAEGAGLHGWRVLHTPGHIDDHVCLLRDDGVMLTGDHVMGWSSSVVIPPEGDMADYMTSLSRLLGENSGLYLPGHGPPITEPHSFVRELLAHRHTREAEVMACLADDVGAVDAMVVRIYPTLVPQLVPMAARNVTAHLLKLAKEGRARKEGVRWVSVA